MNRLYSPLSVQKFHQLRCGKRLSGRARVSLVCGAALTLSALTWQMARAANATFVVNSVADSPDATPGDGLCQTTSGNGSVCTLRAAIQESNALAGADFINFNISPTINVAGGRNKAATVFTIAPTSALPVVTDAVTIDGYTQPGSSVNTAAVGTNATLQIVIDGTATPADSLLVVNGTGSTVRGLVINNGRYNNLELQSGGGHKVEGCFVGTNAAGSGFSSGAAKSNNGITVSSNNNLVGGPTLAARNLISGISDEGIFVGGAGNTIQNNLIGTNASGNGALGNTFGVRLGGFEFLAAAVSPSNTQIINNVISGNRNNGIHIFPNSGVDVTVTATTIQGNIIGLSADGRADLGNDGNGILVDSNNNPFPENNGGPVTGVVIGGTRAGQGNTISGNGESGILLQNAAKVSGVSVQGNTLGLSTDGTVALGNTRNGIVANVNNLVIGGSAAGARNIISGNGARGIEFSDPLDLTIQNNFIGTNRAGNAALGNGGDGIRGGAGNRNAPSLAIENNVISGNGVNPNADSQAGIHIQDSGFPTAQVTAPFIRVRGNIIGLDATGTTDIGNRGFGVTINRSTNMRLDSTSSTAAERNFISGNDGGGVFILQASNNQISGNMIGLASDGSTLRGNSGDGVTVSGDSTDNLIGVTPGTQAGANRIAGNTGNGVSIGGNSTGIRVTENVIFSNGALGIDLGGNGVTANDALDTDNGPNNLQNSPVITATAGNVISATFSAEASKDYRIEFFSSDAADATGFGEGQRFLGSVNRTTDASGDTPAFTFTSPVSIAGQFVSATATDAAGNTSEFSGSLAVAAECGLGVTNTSNSGPGSLRAAIDCANLTPGAQTITIPAGTYALAGTAGEDLNASGDLDIRDDLTLVGSGATTTILDGSLQDRIFDILSPTATSDDVSSLTQVTIRGLTIRNGLVTGHGGGVRSVGILNLEDSTVSGNTANFRPNPAPEPPTSSVGGGVAAIDTPIGRLISLSTLTVTNCTITDNTANTGGGLFGGSSTRQDTMRVTGTTISNNRTVLAPGSSARPNGAGGVSSGGILVMTNCRVVGNMMPTTSEGGGGGFASEGGNSTLTDCTFDNNVAGNGGGGGFENQGGSLTLLNCNFRNNTCGDDSGAGFENEGGTLTMTECVVTGNRSSSATAGDNDGGGGFENEGGSLVMVRCVVSNNSVTGAGRPNSDGTIGGDGGGGFENEGGTLDMTDCTVAGNTSDGPGGGVNNQGSAATLLRCTLSGNSTPANGGGINLDGGDGTLTNCTISNNQASARGGGISDIRGGALLNVTISGNRAASGGAIFQDPSGLASGRTLSFKNTVLTSDSGGNFAVRGEARTLSLDGNISSDATLSAFLTQPSDKNNTQLQLAPLANNGGQTQTQQPLAGSPAIDGGINEGAPPTDQRGETRPFDGDGNGTAIVDSGAVEARPQQTAIPALAINNVSIAEGNSGTSNATFTATLTAPASQNVTVTFSTANGTGTQPADYVRTSGTLTFAVGQTTATVSIPVVGDTIDESDENFKVNLNNPVGATIADGQGIGTIIDDDAEPTATINNVRVTEGNAGSKNATFTISLSNASTTPQTLNFATADGTATAGEDYTATSGTVTIGAGKTKGTVVVPVRGDITVEGDETFFVNLSLGSTSTDALTKRRPSVVVGDSQGVGTILNDDSLSDLQITQTVAPNPVAVGSEATFAVQVRNNGPSASQNVVVSNQLPNGATFLSASGAPFTRNGQILTFTLGTLQNGATRTLQITVRAPSTVGNFTNSATVSGTGAPDSNTGNNSSVASSQTVAGPQNVSGAVQISLGKLVRVGPYVPGLYFRGARFVQRVTIRNNSAGNITGPVSLVLDGLPLSVELVNRSGLTTLPPSGQSFVRLNVGSDSLLRVGESSSIQLEFRLRGSQAPTFTPRVLAGPGSP